MPNWNDVLREIQEYHLKASKSLDLVRKEYLTKLHKHTKRNIIAYYSGWLSKPGVAQVDINDEDKNGFMMAVHKLDRSAGLDLMLHTPGGSIASTQSIVDYLHQMFKTQSGISDIRVIVPQIAMSAGTMMACSAKEILMAKHSNLGPIDPHMNGKPAYGVIREFKRACAEVKRDPSTIPLWQVIIGQYHPAFLGQCENAIKWSNQFVEDQLVSTMFFRQANAPKKAKAIVKKLTDYTGNKTHERHISYDECVKMGLNVKLIEDDPVLQDLVLTVHHCYMHVFMNTSAFKVIENHLAGC